MVGLKTKKPTAMVGKKLVAGVGFEPTASGL